MEIKLITPEQLTTLLVIYNTFPALHLQNKGYEGINVDKLTDEERNAIKKVEEILKESIMGFYRFQNFRVSKETGEPEIRFQYDYNHNQSGLPFSGVGYILIDELINGFREKDA